jgi:DNA polymerase III subunit beta
LFQRKRDQAMEIRITKKCLVAALARTSSIADRKSSMQILSNVLIDASERDQVRISATDLYLFATGTYPAEVVSAGAVTVPAKTIYDVTRNMLDGEITFKTDGDQVIVSGGRSNFQLLVMPPEDFPMVPESANLQFFDIETALLHQMIDQTSFSISTDETRTHLNGALFQGDGKDLRMVTTDGHRLSKVEFKVEDSGFFNFSMVIPNKAISEIKHLVEDDVGSISVAAKDDSIFLRRTIQLDNSSDPLISEVFLVSKLIEDEFPPYEQVIPKGNDRTAVVSRSGLLDALRRVTVVSEEKTLGVRFELSEGLLEIETNNPSVGQGSEQLDISFEGESVTIGFNAKYFIDILTVLRDDEVKLELSGALDPVVIRDMNDYFIGVVMPMRI